MSSDDVVEFTINVTMQRRWTREFLSMLRFMEHLGNLGGSRFVAIYSDGDGDFRPKFKWPENIPDTTTALVTKEIEAIVFDAG